MKVDNTQTLRRKDKMDGQKLRFRKIGKGFIVSRPGPDMMAGRRLTTVYADQFGRQYVHVNGSYELMTEHHDYLAVDYYLAVD